MASDGRRPSTASRAGEHSRRSLLDRLITRSKIMMPPRQRTIPLHGTQTGYKIINREQFRVLHVDEYQTTIEQPDCTTVRYFCSLSTELFLEHPKESGYVAISYTWKENSSLPQSTLHFALHLDGHALPLGFGLGRMVDALHKRGYDRLWIDALCINQANILERSRQVSRMREIYRNASKVVLYLGEASEQASWLFDFVSAPDRDGGLIPDQVFDGLLSVMQNTCWKRAWIIQEIAAAKRVELLCGARSAAWEDFMGVFFRHGVAQRFLRMSTGGLVPGREIRIIDNFRTNPRSSLVEVLSNTRSTQASDPLDVVYSKLSLANDTAYLVPKVSYSITLCSLFTSLAIDYINAKQDLYVLCLANEAQSRDLPSWVPGWTQPAAPIHLLRFFFSGWLSIKHSAPSNMKVRVSRDRRTLSINGRQLDTIGQFSLDLAHEVVRSGMFATICRTALADHFVLPQYNGTHNSMPIFNHFAIDATAFEKSSQTSDRQETIEALGRSTVPGTCALKALSSLPQLADEYTACSDSFLRWYVGHRDLPFADRTLATWAQIHVEQHHSEDAFGSYTNTGGIERSLFDMGWQRALVETVAGRPALVPAAALTGDIICVLFGCPVPVVMRWMEIYHVFIGECYVDDFMDVGKLGERANEQHTRREFVLK